MPAPPNILSVSVRNVVGLGTPVGPGPVASCRPYLIGIWAPPQLLTAATTERARKSALETFELTRLRKKRMVSFIAAPTFSSVGFKTTF